MPNEIDILFVPQWSPFQPPLALPALSAWLDREGITHRCFDLNIKFYHWLLSDDCANLLIRQIDKLAFSLEEKLAYKAIFSNSALYRENIFKKSGGPNIINSTYISNKSLEAYLQAVSDVAQDFRVSPYELRIKDGVLSKKSLHNSLSNPPELLREFTESFISDYIKDNPPRLIGLSCIGQEQLYFTLLIGKELKKRTGAEIVIGGTIFTRIYNRGALPEEWFGTNFDYIIKNEGEKPLVELIRNQKIGDFSAVPGLIYYADGIRESQASLPLTPGEIPTPNFKKMPLADYISPEITLPILSSRGCYWGKCAFCHHGMVYGEKYSSYELSSLLEQVRYLSREYGVKNFSFNDEAIPPKILRNMGHLFPSSEETGWSFTGLIKFENYFTLEDFSNANRAGFRSLYVGLESGSEKVLSLMKKNNTKDAMIKNLRDAHRSNIWVHCFVFFGFPGENEDDAQETLEFIVDNREIIGSVGCGTFSLEHDAPIQKSPEEYGVEIIYKSNDALDVYYEFKINGNTGAAAHWMKRLNDKIYSIDKFSTTNWIPREHQLTLLHYYSPSQLVEWGLDVKNNYGYPGDESLSRLVAEVDHGDYSIFVSSIFRTAAKITGNYREIVKLLIFDDIHAKQVGAISEVILRRLGCENEVVSHAFTPKVI